MLAGVPIPTSAPWVKCIRVATPFFVSFIEVSAYMSNKGPSINHLKQ